MTDAERMESLREEVRRGDRLIADLVGKRDALKERVLVLEGELQKWAAASQVSPSASVEVESSATVARCAALEAANVQLIERLKVAQFAAVTAESSVRSGAREIQRLTSQLQEALAASATEHEEYVKIVETAQGLLAESQGEREKLIHRLREAEAAVAEPLPEVVEAAVKSAESLRFLLREAEAAKDTAERSLSAAVGEAEARWQAKLSVEVAAQRERGARAAEVAEAQAQQARDALAISESIRDAQAQEIVALRENHEAERVAGEAPVLTNGSSGRVQELETSNVQLSDQLQAALLPFAQAYHPSMDRLEAGLTEEMAEKLARFVVACDMQGGRHRRDYAVRPRDFRLAAKLLAEQLKPGPQDAPPLAVELPPLAVVREAPLGQALSVTDGSGDSVVTSPETRSEGGVLLAERVERSLVEVPLSEDEIKVVERQTGVDLNRIVEGVQASLESARVADQPGEVVPSAVVPESIVVEGARFLRQRGVKQEEVKVKQVRGAFARVEVGERTHWVSNETLLTYTRLQEEDIHG